MSKEELIKGLESLINTQSDWGEIIRLTYTKEKGEEYVDISRNGSFKDRVCVTADSGIALIRDVLNSKYFN